MNYLNIAIYCAFLFAFFIIYYLISPAYRYIAIFIGSYIFYGYYNINALIVLFAVTIISYTGGMVINYCSHKKLAYILFFSSEILVLCLYKYTDFLIHNINTILRVINLNIQIENHFNMLLPIGLSFMVFQAITYLSDIYRGNVSIETNIIRYGAFIAFFPTILSGPIQKSRSLIPQISDPPSFNYIQAQKGVLFITWGLFQKIMVANKLAHVSSLILNDYSSHSSAEILIGAVCFSLYIYADFSSYSDIARGISKILGINIGKNFNNPYLSTSVSEFWNRWHISLNDWFIENVYIPLGGNRKGAFRKYINIMIVFFISGLWHGAYWHFVVWGLLNGFFVVICQLLAPLQKRTYHYFRIDPNVESIVFIKRIITFLLITLTWMFFRNSIVDSFEICQKILFFDFISLFNPNLLSICGNTVVTFTTSIVTLLFCLVQYNRRTESECFSIYLRQPFFTHCLTVAVLLCVCIFGICSTDITTNTEFIYFQF